MPPPPPTPPTPQAFRCSERWCPLRSEAARGFARLLSIPSFF